MEVLTEAIITVAEVICGNYPNQEYFSTRSLATDVGNRCDKEICDDRSRH